MKKTLASIIAALSLGITAPDFTPVANAVNVQQDKNDGVELTATYTGDKKPAGEWYNFFSKLNKSMMSAPDVWLMGNRGFYDPVMALRSDISDNGLVTSTIVSYKNDGLDEIIHNFRTVGERKVNRIKVPEYFRARLSDVLMTDEGLEYLCALFNTTSNTLGIRAGLEKLSGKPADQIYISTRSVDNRKTPVTSPVLFIDLGGFNVDAGGQSFVGPSAYKFHARAIDIKHKFVGDYQPPEKRPQPVPVKIIPMQNGTENSSMNSQRFYAAQKEQAIQNSMNDCNSGDPRWMMIYEQRETIDEEGRAIWDEKELITVKSAVYFLIEGLIYSDSVNKCKGYRAFRGSVHSDDILHRKSVFFNWSVDLTYYGENCLQQGMNHVQSGLENLVITRGFDGKHGNALVVKPRTECANVYPTDVQGHINNAQVYDE